jgi:hypothetical protein
MAPTKKHSTLAGEGEKGSREKKGSGSEEQARRGAFKPPRGK